MKSLNTIQSQLNLLRAQLKSIKDSELFTAKEMERLTPALVEHIRIKENELTTATRDMEVKSAVTVPSGSSL